MGDRPSAGRGRSMKSKAGRLSSARWSWASRSLTPPMSTPMGGAKRLLAKPCVILPPGTRWCLRTRCILRWVLAPMTAVSLENISSAQSTPVSSAWGPITSICTRSTAGTMIPRLKKRWKRSMTWSGPARYIGASAMYAWQFAKALYTSDRHGWTRFVSMQPHYNLIYREEEREMLPLCQDQKLAVIPYSPVAKGRLTRKPSKEHNETLRAQTDAVGKRFYTEEDLQIAQRVSDVSEARGLPMAQVALAWMLSKPVVTAPIIGATKPHHLDDAVAAVSVQLTPDEIRHVEEAYQPHPVLGYS